MQSNLSLKTFDDAIQDLFSNFDSGLPERFNQLSKEDQQMVIKTSYPDVLIEKDSEFRL